jgi:hypothetical protein
MSWSWDMVSNNAIEEGINRIARQCKTPEQRKALLKVLETLSREELLDPREDSYAC